MGKRSFLRGLAKDTSANVIAISAAAMIPLVAMVGGGVDASRYYMADSRLQAACDAGALAARRAMGKENWSSEYRTLANNFFDQNFDDGMFGVESLSRTYNASDDGEVVGTMTGNLPTSLMGIFGYDNFQISVSCEADINIANTDIMFVLDTTGSMNWNAAATALGGSDSRINALRGAVASFYDTVDAATGDRAQVRYGIVPYSMNVNVGNVLYDANPAWLATSHTYQSREADWTEGYWDTQTETDTTETDETELDNETPEYYTNDWIFDDYNYYRRERRCERQTPDDIEIDYPDGYSFGPGVTTVNGNTTTTVYTASNVTVWRLQGYYWYNSRSWYCEWGWDIYEYTADVVRTVTTTTTTTTTTEWVDPVFNGYDYKPVTFDLTSLYDDNSITLPIGFQGADQAVSWNGCIEEALTVNSSTWDPIPSGANDLNIDLIPGTTDQQWKPVLHNAFFYRYSDNTKSYYSTNEIRTMDNWNDRPSERCPKQVRKLAEFASKSDLESWLSEANGFVAEGNTYHDIGMIWGARLISPDGIFGTENQTGDDGNGISRHIVFMTDGLLEPYNYGYTPYGVEYWDRRITTDGSSSAAQTNHAARFQAACTLAKNKNISVWVVAFGTELTQNLIDCATSGRSYHADNNDELDAAFNEIAEKIAQLRLTA